MHDTPSPTPSLYTWAGGDATIRTLFHTFYTSVVPSDPILSEVFRHMSAQHMDHVADFVIEVLGGPELYTASNRSHAAMVAHHIGKKLSEAQRAQWMRRLLETADNLGLPDDPEFRSALTAYLEWGSRIARINSHLDDNPIDEDAAMPKWGWGVPGGPYIP